MKRLLLSLLFLLPLLTSAQSNFQKGYVVTTSKDTIRGYIDYKERELNPESFNFKAEINSKARVFSLTNCTAYVIDGLESFQRFAVDITTSTIDIATLSTGPDLRSRRDTVFLKVVQAGKNVTLYTYRDDVKLRFYVKDKDMDEPAELISQIYIKEGTNTMVTGSAYRRQLLALLKKFNPAREGKLSEALKYTKSDISKVVSWINDQELVKPKISSTRFFAGAGLNMTKAVYAGATPFTNDAAVSNKSYSPVITAGVDLFANPAIGKTLYRLELSFMSNKNEISTTTGEIASAALSHSFNQYTVVLSPQVIYNIYNAARIKAFIGAGIGMNFSKYSNNIFTRYNSFRNETEVLEDEIKLESFNFSIPVTAGVVINKKVELSAGYYFPSAITNYNTYSVSVKRVQVGVNYLFGKH